MTVHPFIEAEKQAGHSVGRACELASSSSCPVLIVFAFFQRWFVQGVAGSAVKG
ncbi:hypothetical protein ABZZ74_21580 [Streptomyces sp. NPDC006476]|uniref:hypothetical protein n=1 Tax=Streptomyces sp. NPDC006476 TaxID=3157175 RepID=UPI0033BEA39E